MRRRFLRRVALAFVGFFAFVVLVAAAAVAVVSRFEGGGGHPILLVATVAVAILLVGGLAAGRVVRRTAAPIADVMDAADRVATGDYAARVDPLGTGDTRRLARSFNAMAERLQTDEARRRELLADIAHELRTPLSVIRGNVEGMLDGLYPPDATRLRPLLEETTKMARLLEDLQTLSTAEAGALRLHREPVDVAALVEDAIAAFDARAAGRGVGLEARVEPGLDPLEADPVRLGEVVANLLSNAVRHTPRGGTVTVSARREDTRVIVEVVDTGPGIPAEQLPNVFERFVGSSDSGGTGLGLAIARRLVEAHGGTIEAESDASGTTMRFAIPDEVPGGPRPPGGTGAPRSAPRPR